MSAGYQHLTEKEKQTLRLVVRGHDAKSLARHLGLSVHTVNERLRDARRKLGVSSSREAARLVLEREGETPDSLADKQLGEAAAPPGVGHGPDIAHPWSRGRLAIVAGGTIMLLSLAILSSIALSDAPVAAPTPAASQAAQPAAGATSDVAQSTLAWLALVDGKKWQASWSETGNSFRQMNTLRAWEEASVGGRVPLGDVVKRTFSSQEHVPAPPYGYQMVKFKTSFQNKPDATETVSLVREGNKWRVVGYIID